MLEQLSLTGNAPFSIVSLLYNLGVGVVLSLILSWHFKQFGSTLSNRQEFALVFPFVLLTTILIISIVNVIDPITSDQVTIIAQVKNIVATLIFLSVNAHHWFIQAIVSSFGVVPPMTFNFSPLLTQSILEQTNRMFIIALKIGAPLIAALLFTSVALGLIARTVPQVNIFIVGFPLKIAVGLIGLGLSLPIFSFFLRGIFTGIWADISLLLKVM